MAKFLFNFLIIFLMLTSLSLARIRNDEVRLQSEYGKDLTHVPYFLRYDYYQKYNRDWKKTYYSDRKAFLTDYDNGVAAQKAKDKADARAQAAKERQSSHDLRAANRNLRYQLKAELAAEKAQRKSNEARQKEFQDAIKANEQAIEQMQQSFVHH